MQDPQTSRSPKRVGAAVAGLAVVALAVGQARAATIYDTTTVTGTYFYSGQTNGSSDNLQPVTVDTSSNPSGTVAHVTGLSAIGVNFWRVPTVTPVMLLRFYSNVDNNPAPSTPGPRTYALDNATLLGSAVVPLPATKTGYQDFSVAGLNLNLPTTFGVRETIYTDATMTTVVPNDHTLANVELMLGDPSVGSDAAANYGFADGGTSGFGTLDGRFSSGETTRISFLGSDDIVPEIARLSIQGTITTPEPASLAVVGLAAAGLVRRRRQA